MYAHYTLNGKVPFKDILYINGQRKPDKHVQQESNNNTIITPVYKSRLSSACSRRRHYVHTACPEYCRHLYTVYLQVKNSFSRKGNIAVHNKIKVLNMLQDI